MDMKKKWPILACILTGLSMLGLLITSIIYTKVTAIYTRYFIKSIELDDDYQRYTITVKNSQKTYTVNKTLLSYYVDNDVGVKGYIVLETSKELFNKKPKTRVSDVFINVWYDRVHIDVHI